MAKNTAPCMECKKRVVGCHSTCNAYITYKEENEKTKKREAEIKNANRFYYSVLRFCKSS